MLLLTLIYLAFISLGLPDSVLGSAWPIMHLDFQAKLEFAGLIAIVVSAGTVISSLFATRLIARIGTPLVVAFSVLATALSLFGFANANHVISLILLAIPLGLGAGAIDAALNNFVALHYSAKHMNFLHSFWGLGATAGPLIMAHHLLALEGWRSGYTNLALLQFALVVLLFTTLRLWRVSLPTQHEATEDEQTLGLMGNREVLRLRGVKSQLLLFFMYCSLEAGVGLWLASFLITEKGVNAADAAFWTAMYYMGITLGRFLCGFIASRMGETSLIRAGVLCIGLGVLSLFLPLPLLVAKLSFIFIGLGCAPIYPNTIHLTPQRFGARASQSIIGLSMASAYIGTTFVPPFLGVLASKLTFSYLPFALFVLSAGMLIISEQLKALKKEANKHNEVQAIDNSLA